MGREGVARDADALALLSGPSRVVVAECNEFFRLGLVHVLSRDEAMDVVAVCHDMDSARAAVAQTRPDLLVTALRMPPTHSDEGVVLAGELADSDPEVAVVLLSRFVERPVALRLFASTSERRGYLSKARLNQPDDLIRFLRQVAGGAPVMDPAILELILPGAAGDSVRSLSPLQEAVLASLAAGASNRGIAADHGISLRAVERNINSIFEKLDLTDDPMINRRVKAGLVFARRQPDA